MIENFVGVYDGFADDGFCDSVVAYFDAMKERGCSHSRLSNGEGSPHVRDDTSVHLSYENVVTIDQTKHLSAMFDKMFWCGPYSDYANKYSTLADAATHSVPHLKVQRTEIGGGYHVWHFETANRQVSHRILAFVLYLNDVEEGGETEFLYYPMRVKPRKGTLVLFPAGFTHTHRGNPPISNEKYILTGWVEF